MKRLENDIQLHRLDDYSFEGFVSDKWAINGNPNGGYLMALMSHAAMQQVDRQAPVQVTANFLGRSVPGKVNIKTESMVSSKQFDRLQVQAMQGGKETIRMMITLMQGYQTDNQDYQESAPAIMPFEKCKQVPSLPGYSFFGSVNLRVEPKCLSWMKGKKAEYSKQKGWIYLDYGEHWTTEKLLVAADAFFPPVMMTKGATAWVPTIELSVQIRQLPKTQKLKGIFYTRFITGTLVEEDGEIWDEEGNLILISRQLAQFKQGAPSLSQNMSMRAVSAYIATRNKFN